MLRYARLLLSNIVMKMILLALLIKGTGPVPVMLRPPRN